MDMERAGFIKHGTREILLINFSDCKPHEILPVIDQAKKIICTRPESTVLTLTNVTNMRFDDKVTAELKAFTTYNKPYVKAAAVVGVTGLKKIILEAVMLFSKRKFHAFETVELAKNWLVTN